MLFGASRHFKWFNVFISPTVIFLIVLSLFPILYALILSFSNYSLSSNTETRYIGVTNYLELFNDQLFLRALRNTFLLVATATALEMLFGILLALGLFNYLRSARRIIQTLVIVPMALTPVAVALIWKYIYNTTYGVLNYGLTLQGIHQIDWLGSTDWSLISIIIVDVWQWTPFVLLILLAGLESIPHQSLEMG